MSIGLVVLTWKTTDPYHAHLLGIIKPLKLLPFALPYNKSDRPMFSEMSFKCRSTSIFSSYTIAEPDEDILYKLYPTKPEKAYGLGIYAPKTSTANFLTPRPSLRTIRSQASFGPQPLKSSPVPPLPVYDPEKYKDMPAMQKITNAPKRMYTLRRKNSQRPLRIVQYGSAPSKDRPHALDRSASKDSLSSIYSRSVSGDSPDPSRQPVLRKAPSRRQNAPVPLTSVRRNAADASQPGVRPGGIAQPRLPSRLRENYMGQMTNYNTHAPARLPIVRAVSTFGSVQDWGTVEACNGKPRVSTWTEWCNLPPLPVERARVGGQHRLLR
jgi:hypothetical protein